MSKGNPPPLPPDAAADRTNEPPIMASMAPTARGFADEFDERPAALSHYERGKIRSIVERIQVGDTAEGEAAVQDLLEIVENRRTTPTAQRVRKRLAELDARQGVYLAASGTLTQFNAILAAIHGAAFATVEAGMLKTSMAAALVSHIMAAFFLCWAARPMDGVRAPTALMALAEGHTHTNDTFRNYRRGWRLTLIALAVSALVAFLYMLQGSGIIPSTITPWR